MFLEFAGALTQPSKSGFKSEGVVKSHIHPAFPILVISDTQTDEAERSWRNAGRPTQKVKLKHFSKRSYGVVVRVNKSSYALQIHSNFEGEMILCRDLL